MLQLELSSDETLALEMGELLDSKRVRGLETLSARRWEPQWVQRWENQKEIRTGGQLDPTLENM